MARTGPPARRRRSHQFASALLGNTRTVTVHLPPSYDRAASQRYPVLYLHDGQNVFDDARAAFGVSWRAGETADRLAREGRVPPLILVGIDNTPARHDEYAADRDEARGEGGRGDLYGRFVVREVKPFIDRHYRTLRDRAHTGVAGSSMGALATLSMVRAHHNVFARAGVLSPSLWWAGAKLLRELDRDHAWMKRVRFWLCMGTREGTPRGHLTPHLKRTRHLAAAFDRAGLLPGRDYYYTEVAGAEHNEAAWAARFDKVLLFLFGW